MPTPIKLLNNRVRRTYYGGLCLDQWQGLYNPADGYKPEQWVASTVEARNPNPIEGEGLSCAEHNGNTVTLKSLIEQNPAKMLGQAHTTRYGANPALLVKVLDSHSRLIIQAHPDIEKAMKYFQSPYGKTEAWYILGTRPINGEEPYVMLGFKPGITKARWIEFFEKQDIPAMEDMLHRIPVSPGDIFLVEGGVPHAAGPGLFFLEAQEPTDFTLRTERKNAAGDVLADEQLHQGIGFDKMFDCFKYEGLLLREVLNRWKVRPRVIRREVGGVEISVLSHKHTPFFAIKRFEISGDFPVPSQDSFYVAVVLSGRGKLVWHGGETDAQQSDEFFIPAATQGLRWVGDNLIVIACYPPGNIS